MGAQDQGTEEDAVGPKVDDSHDFQDSHIEPQQDEAAGDREWDNSFVEQGVLDDGKSFVFSDMFGLFMIIDFIKLLGS